MSKNRMPRGRFRSTPAFSFGARTATITSTNNGSNLPGPTAYSPNKEHLMSTIAHRVVQQLDHIEDRMGTNKRDTQWLKGEVTPGPGAYYEQLDSSLRSSKMSMRIRLPERPNKNPGPGQYFKNDKNSKGSIQYSFSRESKHNPFENKSDTPMCYDRQSSLSERSIKIGTSNRKRLTDTERDNPGVGSYTLSRDKDWKASFKVKFGKEKRTGTQSFESLPGPGAYETKTAFYGENHKSLKGPLISNRLEDIAFKKRSSLPGPTQYRPQYTSQEFRVPRLANTRSARPMLFNEPTRSSSMTDFYDYIKNPDKRVKIKFGTEEKLKLVQKATKNVGPGQYQHAVQEILKLKQNQPQFSIGKAKRVILPLPKDKVQGPGPGSHTYEPSHTRSQSVTMPKAQRRPVEKAGPGPAAYHPLQELKKTMEIRFARSRRYESKLSQTPGPGAYELPSEIIM